MTRRFTIDGSPELEAHIASDMDAVQKAVLETASICPIEALVLGGGYGRGEGGVLRENGEETVYNDYDFFVIVPDVSRLRRKSLQSRLCVVGERLGHSLGIHVDFGAPIRVSALPHLPYELMLMELREGHRVIAGPPDILEKMPRYTSERVPLIEGARLLMNRGTGLVLAGQKIRAGVNDEESHQFVVRNIQKAMLACGDVVLMRRDAYSPVCVRRREFFERLDLRGVPQSDELYARYLEALEFKLHPRHTAPKDSTLASWHKEACALFEAIHGWFEHERLGTPQGDWEAYSAIATRTGVPSAAEGLMNIYRNLRAGGLSRWRQGRLRLSPLDHLLRELPRVLYGWADATSEERYLQFWGKVS